MEKTIAQDKAIQNALASIRMEGLRVTSEMEELCRQVLSGKLSLSECLDRL